MLNTTTLPSPPLPPLPPFLLQLLLLLWPRPRIHYDGNMKWQLLLLYYHFKMLQFLFLSNYSWRAYLIMYINDTNILLSPRLFPCFYFHFSTVVFEERFCRGKFLFPSPESKCLFISRDKKEEERRKNVDPVSILTWRPRRERRTKRDGLWLHCPASWRDSIARRGTSLAP